MMGITNVVKGFLLTLKSYFSSEQLIQFIINMEHFGIYTAEISPNALIC